MTGIAHELARWAVASPPDGDDHALARRALLDTVAVAVAARDHPVTTVARELSEAAHWAVAAHVQDFDDLHLPSTTHISAVCVPAALACGGGDRAYLAGAGVMARLGTALGWSHYRAGWHATCTAGAPAAAAAAAVALGLDADGITTAMALAVPAAGGVQQAFGTDAKSLQVGFAVDAGVRAARLAAAGAGAEPAALAQWLDLVGAASGSVELPGPTVPGGLAIKIYPACYALQRPISALAGLPDLDPGAVTRIEVRTPSSALAPLVHHRPTTGLQAKFSLEYAVAAALLDGHTGFASFTDEAVRRPAARRLLNAVEVLAEPGGEGLLEGAFQAVVHRVTGDPVRVSLRLPPGSPSRPPTDAELAIKLDDCVRGTGLDHRTWAWDTAADVLRRVLG